MGEVSLAADEASGGASGPALAEVLGGISATIRAVVDTVFRRGRVPAPPEDGITAYLDWASTLGGEIDTIDVDEIRARLAWFRDLRARAGQPLPVPTLVPTSETPAVAPVAAAVPPDLGHQLPEEAPAAAAVTAPPADASRQVPVAPTIPSRAQIEAREAAERFVEWLRLTGRMGTRTAAQIDADYAEHCDVEDLVPVFPVMLKAEMVKLPGVTVKQAKGKKRGGKRHRPSEWTIRALATVATIPFDLPARRAA